MKRRFPLELVLAKAGTGMTMEDNLDSNERKTKMKTICLFLLMLTSIFLFDITVTKAQDNPAASASSEVVNVGNKICPVSGENVKEKTKATYEYEGKIYNLCCAMCIDQFQKDPAKYIKKVEAELQDESKSGAQAQQTMSAEEGHEGHYH